MWINDLKARFQRSTERRVEDMLPLPELVNDVPETTLELTPLVPISDPSQVEVPEFFRGVGLEQAIYEAVNSGDLALQAFSKEDPIPTESFTCICGLTFNVRAPYEEHRAFAHLD